MILLSRHSSFKWEEKYDCYLKGYFQCGKSHVEIIEELLELSTIDEYIEYLKKLNGEFSFLRETDDFICCAVDKIQSFPLFYSYQNGEIIIADNPESILRLIKEPSLDEAALRQFKVASTAFGNRTLFNELKSLASGEILFYDKKTKEFKVVEYHHKLPARPVEMSMDQYIQEMDEAYTDAIVSGIKGLEDRTIVANVDSSWWARLMLTKLKKLGVEKIVLYSFGTKNNPEIEIGRKMAAYFGYPWYYIEYTGTDWFKWYTGPNRESFEKYSSGYVHVANCKDLFAVDRLGKNQLIPKDAVFMNLCFSGFSRGEMLPKVFLYKNRINENNFKVELLREIASNVVWNIKDFMGSDDYIKDIFDKVDDETYKKSSYSWRFNYAYWKEVLGKYHTSSRRVYEYYGYEWRSLQMDERVLDFWRKVSADKQYSMILENEYDESFHKDLMKEVGISPIKIRPVKLNFVDKVRISLPNSYRKSEIKKRIASIEDAYDKDPIGWYNIVSRRIFDLNKHKFTNILGLESFCYLISFLKVYSR